eukprot:gene4872-6827_t
MRESSQSILAICICPQSGNLFVHDNSSLRLLSMKKQIKSIKIDLKKINLAVVNMTNVDNLSGIAVTYSVHKMAQTVGGIIRIFSYNLSLLQEIDLEYEPINLCIYSLSCEEIFMLDNKNQLMVIQAHFSESSHSIKNTIGTTNSKQKVIGMYQPKKEKVEYVELYECQLIDCEKLVIKDIIAPYQNLFIIADENKLFIYKRITKLNPHYDQSKEEEESQVSKGSKVSRLSKISKIEQNGENKSIMDVDIGEEVVSLSSSMISQELAETSTISKKSNKRKSKPTNGLDENMKNESMNNNQKPNSSSKYCRFILQKSIQITEFDSNIIIQFIKLVENDKILIGFNDGSIKLIKVEEIDPLFQQNSDNAESKSPSVISTLCHFIAHENLLNKPMNVSGVLTAIKCPWVTSSGGKAYTLEIFTIGMDHSIKHWGIRKRDKYSYEYMEEYDIKSDIAFKNYENHKNEKLQLLQEKYDSMRMNDDAESMNMNEISLGSLNDDKEIQIEMELYRADQLGEYILPSDPPSHNTTQKQRELNEQRKILLLHKLIAFEVSKIDEGIPIKKYLLCTNGGMILYFDIYQPFKRLGYDYDNAIQAMGITSAMKNKDPKKYGLIKHSKNDKSVTELTLANIISSSVGPELQPIMRYHAIEDSAPLNTTEKTILLLKSNTIELISVDSNRCIQTFSTKNLFEQANNNRPNHTLPTNREKSYSTSLVQHSFIHKDITNMEGVLSSVVHWSIYKELIFVGFTSGIVGTIPLQTTPLIVTTKGTGDLGYVYLKSNEVHSSEITTIITFKHNFQTKSMVSPKEIVVILLGDATGGLSFWKLSNQSMKESALLSNSNLHQGKIIGAYSCNHGSHINSRIIVTGDSVGNVKSWRIEADGKMHVLAYFKSTIVTNGIGGSQKMNSFLPIPIMISNSNNNIDYNILCICGFTSGKLESWIISTNKSMSSQEYQSMYQDNNSQPTKLSLLTKNNTYDNSHIIRTDYEIRFIPSGQFQLYDFLCAYSDGSISMMCVDDKTNQIMRKYYFNTHAIPIANMIIHAPNNMSSSIYNSKSESVDNNDEDALKMKKGNDSFIECVIVGEFEVFQILAKSNSILPAQWHNPAKIFSSIPTFESINILNNLNPPAKMIDELIKQNSSSHSMGGSFNVNDNEEVITVNNSKIEMKNYNGDDSINPNYSFSDTLQSNSISQSMSMNHEIPDEILVPVFSTDSDVLFINNNNTNNLRDNIIKNPIQDINAMGIAFDNDDMKLFHRINDDEEDFDENKNSFIDPEEFVHPTDKIMNDTFNDSNLNSNTNSNLNYVNNNHNVDSFDVQSLAKSLSTVSNNSMIQDRKRFVGPMEAMQRILSNELHFAKKNKLLLELFTQSGFNKTDGTITSEQTVDIVYQWIKSDKIFKENIWELFRLLEIQPTDRLKFIEVAKIAAVVMSAANQFLHGQNSGEKNYFDKTNNQKKPIIIQKKYKYLKTKKNKVTFNSLGEKVVEVVELTPTISEGIYNGYGDSIRQLWNETSNCKIITRKDISSINKAKGTINTIMNNIPLLFQPLILEISYNSNNNIWFPNNPHWLDPLRVIRIIRTIFDMRNIKQQEIYQSCSLFKTSSYDINDMAEITCLYFTRQYGDIKLGSVSKNKIIHFLESLLQYSDEFPIINLMKNMLFLTDTKNSLLYKQQQVPVWAFIEIRNILSSYGYIMTGKVIKNEYIDGVHDINLTEKSDKNVNKVNYHLIRRCDGLTCMDEMLRIRGKFGPSVYLHMNKIINKIPYVYKSIEFMNNNSYEYDYGDYYDGINNNNNNNNNENDNIDNQMNIIDFDVFLEVIFIELEQIIRKTHSVELKVFGENGYEIGVTARSRDINLRSPIDSILPQLKSTSIDSTITNDTAATSQALREKMRQLRSSRSLHDNNNNQSNGNNDNISQPNSLLIHSNSPSFSSVVIMNDNEYGQYHQPNLLFIKLLLFEFVKHDELRLGILEQDKFYNILLNSSTLKQSHLQSQVNISNIMNDMIPSTTTLEHEAVEFYNICSKLLRDNHPGDPFSYIDLCAYLLAWEYHLQGDVELSLINLNSSLLILKRSIEVDSAVALLKYFSYLQSIDHPDDPLWVMSQSSKMSNNSNNAVNSNGNQSFMKQNQSFSSLPTDGNWYTHVNPPSNEPGLLHVNKMSILPVNTMQSSHKKTLNLIQSNNAEITNQFENIPVIYKSTRVATTLHGETTSRPPSPFSPAELRLHNIKSSEIIPSSANSFQILSNILGANDSVNGSRTNTPFDADCDLERNSYSRSMQRFGNVPNQDFVEDFNNSKYSPSNSVYTANSAIQMVSRSRASTSSRENMASIPYFHNNNDGFYAPVAASNLELTFSGHISSQPNDSVFGHNDYTIVYSPATVISSPKASKPYISIVESNKSISKDQSDDINPLSSHPSFNNDLNDDNNEDALNDNFESSLTEQRSVDSNYIDYGITLFGRHFSEMNNNDINKLLAVEEVEKRRTEMRIRENELEMLLKEEKDNFEAREAAKQNLKKKILIDMLEKEKLSKKFANKQSEERYQRLMKARELAEANRLAEEAEKKAKELEIQELLLKNQEKSRLNLLEKMNKKQKEEDEARERVEMNNMKKQDIASLAMNRQWRLKEKEDKLMEEKRKQAELEAFLKPSIILDEVIDDKPAEIKLVPREKQLTVAEKKMKYFKDRMAICDEHNLTHSRRKKKGFFIPLTFAEDIEFDSFAQPSHDEQAQIIKHESQNQVNQQTSQNKVENHNSEFRYHTNDLLSNEHKNIFIPTKIITGEQTINMSVADNNDINDDNNNSQTLVRARFDMMKRLNLPRSPFKDAHSQIPRSRPSSTVGNNSNDKNAINDANAAQENNDNKNDIHDENNKDYVDLGEEGDDIIDENIIIDPFQDIKVAVKKYKVMVEKNRLALYSTSLNDIPSKEWMKIYRTTYSDWNRFFQNEQDIISSSNKLEEESTELDSQTIDSQDSNDDIESFFSGYSPASLKSTFPSSLLMYVKNEKNFEIFPLPFGRVEKNILLYPKTYKYYQIEVTDLLNIVTIDFECRKGSADLYMKYKKLPNTVKYDYKITCNSLNNFKSRIVMKPEKIGTYLIALYSYKRGAKFNLWAFASDGNSSVATKPVENVSKLIKKFNKLHERSLSELEIHFPRLEKEAAYAVEAQLKELKTENENKRKVLTEMREIENKSPFELQQVMQSSIQEIPGYDAEDLENIEKYVAKVGRNSMKVEREKKDAARKAQESSLTTVGDSHDLFTLNTIETIPSAHSIYDVDHNIHQSLAYIPHDEEQENENYNLFLKYLKAVGSDDEVKNPNNHPDLFSKPRIGSPHRTASLLLIRKSTSSEINFDRSDSKDENDKKALSFSKSLNAILQQQQQPKEQQQKSDVPQSLVFPSLRPVQSSPTITLPAQSSFEASNKLPNLTKKKSSLIMGMMEANGLQSNSMKSKMIQKHDPFLAKVPKALSYSLPIMESKKKKI